MLNKATVYIPIALQVSALELLETVQLLQDGLITEDEFLFAVGYDIPEAQKALPAPIIRLQLTA